MFNCLLLCISEDKVMDNAEGSKAVETLCTDDVVRSV